MGFDVKRFEGQVKADLICSICTDVLEDPVQRVVCEHYFCRQCITRWLKRSSVCPLDMETLKESDLKDAPRLLKSFIAELNINCDFASVGCPMFVKLEQLVVHVKDCDFNPQFNLICSKGCGAMFKRSAVSSHDCIKHLLDVVKSMETTRCLLEKEKEETINRLMREKREGEEALHRMRFETKNRVAVKREEEQEKQRLLNQLEKERLNIERLKSTVEEMKGEKQQKEQRLKNQQKELKIRGERIKQLEEELRERSQPLVDRLAQDLQSKDEKLKALQKKWDNLVNENNNNIRDKKKTKDENHVLRQENVKLKKTFGQKEGKASGDKSCSPEKDRPDSSRGVTACLPIPPQPSLSLVVKFSPGDIIVTDIESFAHSLKTRFKGDGCDWCFNRMKWGECSQLKRCSTCQVMFYCSRKCQANDWRSGHKWECDYFSRTDQFEELFAIEDIRTRPEWSRIFTRTVLKLRKNPGISTQSFGLYDGQEISLSGVTKGQDGSNVSLSKETIEQIECFREILVSVSGEPLVSLKGLIEVRNKMEKVCVPIKNPNGMFPMGSGLYLITALFPQDLSPNAQIKFKGNLLEVRALKQIMEGEPVTLNKIDPLIEMNFVESPLGVNICDPKHAEKFKHLKSEKHPCFSFESLLNG